MNEKCLNLIDYFLIIGKQEIHEKRDDNNLKDMNLTGSQMNVLMCVYALNKKHMNVNQVDIQKMMEERIELN